MIEAWQISIYAPQMQPYGTSYEDRWYETTLGEVVAPVVASNRDAFEWLWFGHYPGPRGPEAAQDRVPDSFGANLRWTKVRFQPKADQKDTIVRAFEARKGLCHISPAHRDEVSTDLGSPEWLAGPPTSARQDQRARCAINVLQAASEFVLDTLINDESGWHFERSFHVPSVTQAHQKLVHMVGNTCKHQHAFGLQDGSTVFVRL